MKCNKCGANVSETMKFCPWCGAATAGVQNANDAGSYGTSGTAYGTTNKSISKKKLAIILASVAAAVVLIIIIATSGRGYEQPVKTYFKALETGNYKLLYDVYADYWKDGYIDFTGSEYYLEEVFENDIEEAYDRWGYHDSIKVTYKIDRVEKATKEQIKEVGDDIYDSIIVDYAYFDYDRENVYKTITDAAIVYITYKVNVGYGYDERTTQVLLVKEKGKWKFTRGYMYNSFWQS